MNQEIERKYEIKAVPQNLKIEAITDIEQFFIYDDGMTLIRLRKQVSVGEKNIKPRYRYTLKTKQNMAQRETCDISQKYEIEYDITPIQYEELQKKQINSHIQKTRIVVPIGESLKAEIDVYQGYLTGLVTVEVEFETEEQSKQFQKPEWFGEELGYQTLSNRLLSKMTEEEWKSKVTKEWLEQNEKISQELMNRVIKFKK